MTTPQLKPSPWLYNFLRGFEKFRPTAYLPTGKDVWTIGYGHTRGVKPGDTCTLNQGEVWLGEDVAGFYAGILPLIHVTLTQAELDALVSLTFNIGIGRRDGHKGDFADSTLLDKLNAGDKAGAAAEFPKWDHQGGMELDGLRTRRIAEAARFLTP
jgi:lysozyme